MPAFLRSKSRRSMTSAGVRTAQPSHGTIISSSPDRRTRGHAVYKRSGGGRWFGLPYDADSPARRRDPHHLGDRAISRKFKHETAHKAGGLTTDYDYRGDRIAGALRR